MAIQFTKAVREQKKLRMALIGPSGSGKTMTSLQIASGITNDGRIALIDTEHGSASLYGDQFEFDVIELDNYNPQHYINAISAAEEGGYEALIIDSLSHAWMGESGVLDQVNRRGGNSFSEGWGKVGTPLQNRLVNAILSARLHVVGTMRTKTEYVVEQNTNGKAAPRRVGTTAVQREGLEYEFDVVGVLSIDNTLTIEKSRMPGLSGEIISKPGPELGKRIGGWLGSGAAVQPPAVVTSFDPVTDDQWAGLTKAWDMLGVAADMRTQRDSMTSAEADQQLDQFRNEWGARQKAPAGAAR